MSEPKLSLAFARIADLCIALDQAPLPRHPECWECQVDETWWIAVNGHSEKRMTSDGFDVPPFNAVIKYNGWPAGVMDPYGGCIAAGEGANENTFIAALDSAIETARNTACEHEWEPVKVTGDNGVIYNCKKCGGKKGWNPGAAVEHWESVPNRSVKP